MGYTKQNFVKGQTLKAEHLNHMEDGISELDNIVVKSVNGVFPNEDGNIVSDKAFREDMSVFDGRVMARKTAQEIADACIQSKTAPVFTCIFDSNTDMRYVSTEIESRFVGTMGVDGHFVRVLHFDDDKVPPIIVDGVNNTITVDPDWTAVKSNQYLTTDTNGNKIWEDKLCYSYRQEYQVHEGFTVPSGSKMLYGQTPDVIEPIIVGETYTVIWDDVEYTCVAREEPDSNFGVVLGNLHLLESQYEDTGEPFEIVGWYQHNMAQIIRCADDAGHTCGGAKGSKTYYTAIDGHHIGGGVYRGEGSHSTAIGDQCRVLGNDSVAMNSATVEGISSVGEGFSYVHAGANNAHAEGSYTDVYGAAGHVEGYATISHGTAQHVQGILNIIDEEDRYAHIVGNGENSVRSNAHTLDWDGNAWFAGDVIVGGQNQDDQNAKVLATKEYVDTKVPNVSNAHQYLTTDADGNSKWEDKICCMEIGEVTFFDEDTLYPYTGTIYNLYGYLESQSMIIGKTYKVTTNGVTYECVAKYNESNGIYIGNDSIQDSSYEDTGEPFFIMRIEPDSAAFCMLKEAHDDWTFTIVGPGEIIRTIPGEYIAGGLHKGSGKNSFCVKDTEANGDYAWALGGGTKANGYYSMALGLNSETQGAGCIAEGKSTIATSPYQHVQGTYNIEDTDGKYAHIVGNGKREYGVTTRSNAYTLDWNGNAEFAGDVIANGCGGESPISITNLANRVEVKTIQIIDGTAMVPDMVQNNSGYEVSEIVDLLRDTTRYEVVFNRMIMAADSSGTEVRKSTGFKVVNVGDGTYNAIVYFGSDLAPITFNSAENKLTLG